MESVEIERQARLLGVDVPTRARKATVVRAIQRRRGEIECFATVLNEQALRMAC